ncbi:hypothetical protein LZ32DRAFT_440376 [Colletotrichum eremochloae]|nr:hypothetical protein LZ32DRAFT_440376 [Colletotrichum eremochloae]
MAEPQLFLSQFRCMRFPLSFPYLAKYAPTTMACTHPPPKRTDARHFLPVPLEYPFTDCLTNPVRPCVQLPDGHLLSTLHNDFDGSDI